MLFEIILYVYCLVNTMFTMNEQARNIQFVKEIQRYPCLYNYKLPTYSRKECTENAWSKVGKVTNLSISECKTRWKNLRSVFVRKMKLLPSGVEERKPYYLYKYMLFVKPYIKLKRSFVKGEPVPSTNSSEEERDVEGDNEIQETRSEVSIAPSIASNNSDSSFPNTLQIRNFSKQNISDAIDYPLVEQKQFRTNNSNSTMNANKMFLLSLLPDLNMMTSSQIRRFKRSVMTTIDDILNESPASFPVSKSTAISYSRNQYVFTNSTPQTYSTRNYLPSPSHSEITDNCQPEHFQNSANSDEYVIKHEFETKEV